MKALSIRQPWAWLIVNGYKPVENRTWPTQHRGDTLIHAGLAFDTEGLTSVLAAFPELRGQMPDRYDLGGVIGVAQVVGCVEQHPSRWFMGPYGHVLYGARALPFVPLRGQLGYFEAAMSAQLHAALHAIPAVQAEAAGQDRLFG